MKPLTPFQSMIHLNLRQKMICCFCLHLTFYGVYGLTFLKDFNVFTEDVNLLTHAGNLSNICLEIRRYEKNFIIRHDEEDFLRVGAYLEEAQKYVPQVKSELRLITRPLHLEDLQKTLADYEKVFLTFRGDCSPESNDFECPSLVMLRKHGQELVYITEQLVHHEQLRMTNFMDTFKGRLYQSIAILLLLSVLTLFMLYGSIILPLKSIEKAAADIAAGTFRQFRLPKKRDEVISVLSAFNQMVMELEEQQEQLFQAKKLSSIGTLASGTAHQINNPLNNIATSCQLALTEIDAKQSPFVEQMLQTIDQETQRAGEIVRGLLEFSRVHTFCLRAVPLKSVVDKVLQLVASEVPAGITIEQQVSEEITLLLDVQKMTEALLNLLLNGVQAIKEPPGCVTIRAEEKDDEAIIIIEDTGSGIDQEDLQKVFDPFFTTKQEGNGTGLGLAVVYGIIKKHNGSIRVESTKGKGTQFIITLPLSKEFSNTTNVQSST